MNKGVAGWAHLIQRWEPSTSSFSNIICKNMSFGVLIGIRKHHLEFKSFRGCSDSPNGEPWSNWPAAGKTSSSNVHRCASNDSIPSADHWNSFGNAHTFPKSQGRLTFRVATNCRVGYIGCMVQGQHPRCGTRKHSHWWRPKAQPWIKTQWLEHSSFHTWKINDIQHGKKTRKLLIITCCCCCSCIESGELLLYLNFFKPIHVQVLFIQWYSHTWLDAYTFQFATSTWEAYQWV